MMQFQFCCPDRFGCIPIFRFHNLIRLFLGMRPCKIFFFVIRAGRKTLKYRDRDRDVSISIEDRDRRPIFPIFDPGNRGKNDLCEGDLDIDLQH